MTLLLEPSPGDVAEQRTGRQYLSYSQISTYQSCPLRWYFNYVEGLAEEVVSASFVFGGAIHSAAEFHFRSLQMGEEPPDLDTLLDVYQEAWREREAEVERVRFGKTEDINSLGNLAERVLTAFRGSDFATPDGIIVGVEEELRGEVVPGCPELLARIDLLVADGDHLVVTDLKTARSSWSRSQVDESAEQLLLYSELARELDPGRPIELQFAVVTKTKNPELISYNVPFNDRRLERTKQVLRRVWQSMQAGHVYPVPSPINCPSCPFRQPCRRWSG